MYRRTKKTITEKISSKLSSYSRYLFLLIVFLLATSLIRNVINTIKVRRRINEEAQKIENLEKKGTRKKVYDIRGNTVLQNDFLGQDRILEEVKETDYLLLKKVGAYGFVMASGFPGKKLPKQILINNGNIEEI